MEPASSATSPTRSRAGCRRCRMVSRKCDEHKPACGRCQRLRFECNYQTRLVWVYAKESLQKAASRKVRHGLPDKERLSMNGSGAEIQKWTASLPPLPVTMKNGNRGHLKVFPSHQPTILMHSLLPNIPYWATSLGLDPTDFGLFHDFLRHGQRMLHYSSLSCNPIIHYLLPRCHRSMALTAAVLCFQASQAGGVESFARFDKAMVLYRSMPSTEDITYILDTGLIICNASMQLGYKWTTLLHRLCCLAEACLCPKGRNADTEYVKQLEVLASMDLDLWIMGRRTPSRHIWATWCLGRDGIEQITGLPRSLLDLMALSCLGRDISADIREWITTLSTQEDASARRHIWQACAIATLLHMHSMHFTILSDVDDLTEALKAHMQQFREAILVDRDLNARQALWPLYVVGKSAVDVHTRLYVKKELEGLGLYGDTESKSRILAILEETWARTDAGEDVTIDSVAIEHDVELGIW